MSYKNISKAKSVAKLILNWGNTYFSCVSCQEIEENNDDNVKIISCLWDVKSELMMRALQPEANAV